MDRDERDEGLARLRAATEAIAPDDRLTDAIVAAVTMGGDPLANIAEATQSLDATSGLSDAVMSRVRLENAARARGAPSWLDGVVRTGPIAVGLAVIAAAAAFALFVSSQSDVDANMASSVDAVEVLE